MPRTWIYSIALVLPMLFSILVLYTPFVDWLWYQQHEGAYYLLSALKVNPWFVEFLGGWGLPVFTCTVVAYWQMDHDDDAIASQFMLLPIAYVPFSIIGAMLTKLQFDATFFYTHPLVVIPVGYLYLFPWMLFVWVFSKLRLVM